MPTAELAAWTRESNRIEKWEYPEDLKSGEEDAQLQAEIDRAKSILALKPDWDDEGSQPYSKETLDRAIAFLTSQSKHLYETCGLHPLVPRISAGPDGSIDIHWKRNNFELLVNIPADSAQNAVFYGDDYGIKRISGNFDPQKINQGILEWLMN
jgi:hypothetical protein